eukprot:GHVO01034199.1.p1 GENE.GHVO01034199.1~~GHVO01034199.1.p1  ORF type:complete len:296 (-),score=65.02 GHVO01034199.1:203-1090(-)
MPPPTSEFKKNVSKYLGGVPSVQLKKSGVAMWVPSLHVSILCQRRGKRLHMDGLPCSIEVSTGRFGICVFSLEETLYHLEIQKLMVLRSDSGAVVTVRDLYCYFGTEPSYAQFPDEVSTFKTKGDLRRLFSDSKFNIGLNDYIVYGALKRAGWGVRRHPSSCTNDNDIEKAVKGMISSLSGEVEFVTDFLNNPHTPDSSPHPLDQLERPDIDTVTEFSVPPFCWAVSAPGRSPAVVQVNSPDAPLEVLLEFSRKHAPPKLLHPLTAADNDTKEQHVVSAIVEDGQPVFLELCPFR